MKMFLTRFGMNSRMVICGDPHQVDIPGGERMSGLNDAVQRLEGVEGIQTIRFNSSDVFAIRLLAGSSMPARAQCLMSTGRAMG
jgi:phosphate starvation-inducible protein PhoH